MKLLNQTSPFLNLRAISSLDNYDVQRFEYRIETLKVARATRDEQLVQTLNKWGRQGWRVCHMAFEPDAGEDDKACVLLERRLDNWLLSEEDD